MRTCTAQASATVRTGALGVNLAMPTLCLCGVVIGLTWGAFYQTMVAQQTAPIQAWLR
jgi:hypothetical protein